LNNWLKVFECLEIRNEQIASFEVKLESLNEFFLLLGANVLKLENAGTKALKNIKIQKKTLFNPKSMNEKMNNLSYLLILQLALT
jgi:hypothetical protein